MSSIRLETSWQDLDGKERSEYEATFATLRIRVGDEVVTQAHHRGSATTRDQNLVPLYLIAEWIVANWWLMTEESEVPGRPSFFLRHSLAGGREGYCLPDLRFIREGADTRLEWRRTAYQHGQIEYLSEGTSRLAHDHVVEALSDFVAVVDERLRNAGITDSWMQAEWHCIQDSIQNADEADFCRAAAWLGLDPYEVSDDDARTLTQFLERLPESLHEDALRSVVVANAHDLAQWVEDAITRCPPSQRNGSLANARGRYRGIGHTRSPSKTGYEVAQRFRQDYCPASTIPFPIEDLWDEELPIVKAPHAIPNVDGLGFIQEGLRCYTTKTRQESQRFIVARTLFDFLVLDAPYGLLSRARTERQQAGRAFAAELLAPSEILRKKLPEPSMTRSDILDIAAELEVSAYLVEHQIRNFRLARIDDDLDFPG